MPCGYVTLGVYFNLQYFSSSVSTFIVQYCQPSFRRDVPYPVLPCAATVYRGTVLRFSSTFTTYSTTVQLSSPNRPPDCLWEDNTSTVHVPVPKKQRPHILRASVIKTLPLNVHTLNFKQIHSSRVMMGVPVGGDTGTIP